jgi:hypothetical protein
VPSMAIFRDFFQKNDGFFASLHHNFTVTSGGRTGQVPAFPLLKKTRCFGKKVKRFVFPFHTCYIKARRERSRYSPEEEAFALDEYYTNNPSTVDPSKARVRIPMGRGGAARQGCGSKNTALARRTKKAAVPNRGARALARAVRRGAR